MVQPVTKRSFSIMRMFHRAGLILCLSVILVAAERGCPYPEEIEPCTCVGEWADVTLTCRRVHDTQVLLRVFENASQFRFNNFTLIDSSLQFIPHQIFDDVVVNMLYLANVTLRNIFDEVPKDPDILEIHADRAKILGGLDWKKLAVFKKLESIFIWNTPLKQLSADFRINVSKKLSTFFCMNCKIQKLDEKVFADFTDLTTIQLHKNAIRDIKRTMFPRNIQSINLEFNKISSLPNDIFSDMPFLKDVELTGNQMAVLPEDTFRPVISQLKNLDVRENPIKCDCRIKWVLQERRYVIQGNCYGPKAIHNKPFYKLTRDDIRC